MELYIPVLREGIEIDKFDTSSEEQTYILQFDKRYWQISEYLYTIISFIDGNNSLELIADKMTAKMGIEIKKENIQKVIDAFLAKNGLLTGTTATGKKPKKGVAAFLWLKIPLLKAGVIKYTRLFSTLFNPSIIISAMAVIILTVAFMIFQVATKRITIDYSSVNYIYTLLLVMVATLFHELGHSAASMRYGLVPKEIGFAFYFASPVLYTDVSSTWTLKRKERVMVDAGGIYFELIYLCTAFILGYIFNSNLLVLVGIIGVFSIQRNINPIIKMDGYWLLSDLLGIPNLHEVSIEASRNAILRLFGVKRERTYITKIGKVEKIFFVIYASLFSVLLYFMVFMLSKFFIHLPQTFYNNIMTIFTDATLDLKARLLTIGRTVSLLIIGIMMIRVVFYSLSGLFSMIIDIVRGVLTAKRSKLHEVRG